MAEGEARARMGNAGSGRDRVGRTGGVPVIRRFPVRTHLLALALATAVTASPLGAQEGEARRLSLDEALGLALARSEAVAAAEGGVTTARGQRIQARAERFPQLNASASYQRTLQSQFAAGGGGGGAPEDSAGGPGGNPGGPSGPPVVCPPFMPNPMLPLPERVDSLEKAVQCSSANGGAGGLAGLDFGGFGFGAPNTYNFGLSAAYALYTGGRVRAQNRAAEAGVRSAELEVEAQRAQTAVDVTEAYYAALLSARLVEIAEATLEQAELTLRDTEAGVRVGTVAEYDLLRARVARNNQRPLVIRQQASRDVAFARLKQLLDIPLDQALVLSTGLGDAEVADGAELPAALPDAAADTAVAARVPVRQAAENVRVQEAQLGIARAARRPSVSVQSDYALIAFPQEFLPRRGDFTDNWTVGLAVSMPLLDFGRTRGPVVSAQGNLSQARVRLEQVREAAALDARTRLREVDAARAAWEASAGTVEEAARAYEIAQVRYRQGLSTQTELNDTRLALQEARSNRAQAARDLQVARVRALLVRDLPLQQGTQAGVQSGQTQGQPGQAGAQGRAQGQGTRTQGTGARGGVGGIPGQTTPNQAGGGRP